MTDQTIETAGNIPEYTVSELSQAVKRSIEGSFQRVRVRGEVSRLARPRSGHLYFRLKDENAVIEAVCWRGVVAGLRYPPEDGLEIICSGRLTTYPGRSQYQIIVDHVEPAGEGALLKLLEDRRKALAAEGLFDDDRKQPVPYLPEVIGVVTSPTGAVIRDILHRLADRFPRRVLLWPVAVQGEAAAAEIAHAINRFNAIEPGGPVPRPNVLIIARGGGSLEDLWAFNEEVVVRAAAASAIPLISAVGHETDTTLIDFAADLRAPTPTAAAEMAVPVRAELVARVLDLGGRLVGAMGRAMESRRGELRGLARGLPADPNRLLEGAVQRLDNAAERMTGALRLWVERKRAALPDLRPGPLRAAIARRHAAFGELPSRLARALARGMSDARGRFDAQVRLLDGFGYQQVLGRGFALVRDDSGAPVVSAAMVTPGMGVELTFHDGASHATINGAPAAKPRPRKPRPAPTKTDQG
ncbi:MAG: exodeoxyribonuclease VII large subunit, partial [Pseudomonadota bacterium]|nr:exodeoxyribonuclease VII large subunit [Pseudomonadota bacterium]